LQGKAGVKDDQQAAPGTLPLKMPAGIIRAKSGQLSAKKKISWQPATLYLSSKY